jgi:3-deoxy-manno-octulosonate cytidylyltransferase (CMP-KDO synthetase)
MPISYKEAQDPSIVKCVKNDKNQALYFSRAPIPYVQGVKPTNYLAHLGFYAYRTQFLLETYANLPYSSLQEVEDLEQLAVLEAGYPIAVATVPKQIHGVNTPKDLKRIEEHLCNQNIYS